MGLTVRSLPVGRHPVFMGLAGGPGPQKRNQKSRQPMPGRGLELLIEQHSIAETSYSTVSM
jgi:hypothetical protein